MLQQVNKHLQRLNIDIMGKIQITMFDSVHLYIKNPKNADSITNHLNIPFAVKNTDTIRIQVMNIQAIVKQHKPDLALTLQVQELHCTV